MKLLWAGALVFAVIALQASAQEWNFASAEAAIAIAAKTRDSKHVVVALQELERPFSTCNDTGNVQSIGKPPKTMAALLPWLHYYAVQDSIYMEIVRDYKPPLVKVLPPPVSPSVPHIGPVIAYLAPVDPATLPDPEQRKKYEAMIAENERRRKASFEIHDLGMANLRAGSFLWLWGNGALANSPELLREIPVEAAKAGCTPERAAWVVALFEKTQRGAPPDPFEASQRAAMHAAFNH